ncbi:glycoside hydrolase [Teratosphaeria nubilosa]|uniref:alpha-1,2-Mannosidase n=1 Tax=Teratosphaeria nubilosa TaxID=161662 RepID=A0A6G1KU81_9PEZI|nr:glycoside hydrolase [Teratosphaeria nubilosa]
MNYRALKAIVALIVVGALVLLNALRDGPSLSKQASPQQIWDFRKQQVREAFVESWDAYKEYAWGKDRFHPISKTGSQMSPSGLGWMIVDSLDTLMIMNLTSRIADAEAWVATELDYDQDQDVNTFETTIRMLGGLLSAHYLSTRNVDNNHQSIYLTKATALADRLLGAYGSPSGIPYASLQLNTANGIVSHTDGGASSTAEATTLQLEMKYLAYLTGNETYWRKAEHVMEVVDDNQAPDGLVPIFVDPRSGRFVSAEIRLGSRGDSYYEYLVKQYLQTGESTYEDMWQEALAGIKGLIVPTRRSKLPIVAELPYGVGGPLSPKMDHLVCFLPAAIALGATGGTTEARARKLPSWSSKKDEDMQLARELTKTCYAMYAVPVTGIAPEIVWLNVHDQHLRPKQAKKAFKIARSSDDIEKWRQDVMIKPLDAHNLQRPETVESLFIMWRITHDEIYRSWGWKIFEAWRDHARLGDGKGYTSLNDVRIFPASRRDNMESFWLAETLKYLYLLFSDDDELSLSEVLFNTEAHVLPIIKNSSFGTGWSRRPR